MWRCSPSLRCTSTGVSEQPALPSLQPQCLTRPQVRRSVAHPVLLIPHRVPTSIRPRCTSLHATRSRPQVLLLRQVLSAATGKFGPVFWAANEVPQGFEQATAINGVLTLASVDDQTREDIALLQNLSFVPCTGSKCEMCLEGCQVFWRRRMQVCARLCFTPCRTGSR